MDYINQKEVHLMVWEENPKKRNINNEIKFNISDKLKIEIGDKIKCNLGSGRYSVYEITEIIDVRKSSLKGMNYYTAKTKHYND